MCAVEANSLEGSEGVGALRLGWNSSTELRSAAAGSGNLGSVDLRFEKKKGEYGEVRHDVGKMIGGVSWAGKASPCRS